MRNNKSINKIIGRQNERNILLNAIQSRKPELGVVYGRRRIGKSFLLKSLNAQRNYYFEAIKGLSVGKQIAHFLKQFSQQEKLPPLRGDSWEEAFDIVTKYFENGQIYVVFDEFPWMASEKTELVSLLKYYWDNKWSRNSQLTLVLCGSVAHFMVKHIIHSQALHNRKTFEIKLKPLNCEEASQFFPTKYSLYEKTLFLLTLGGVPKYLEQMDVTVSFQDNLLKHFFSEYGFFINEFDTIFKEQFKKYKTYNQIVEYLAKKPMSMSELGRELKLTGGGFKEYLDNLENTDFIERHVSFNFLGKEKVRTIKYKVSDEFLHFYFSFLKMNLKKISQGMGSSVLASLQTRKLDAFMGIAFERFCQKNIRKIMGLLNLEIGNILNYGPYYSQNDGVQVDLMIILKKNRVLVGECKFTVTPVGLAVVKEMQGKIEKLAIPKAFSISPFLISASGITEDVKDAEYFDKIITLEDLLFDGP